MTTKVFRTIKGQKLSLPLFFPDATRAVLKTLDSLDIKNTQTPGVLVNTFHLYFGLAKKVLDIHHGVGNFMSWDGGLISDSGGFQVMSIIKSNPAQGRIIDEGLVYRPSRNKKILFTPEKSIRFQSTIRPDMLIVLDDFTPPGADYQQAKITVERTISWAKRCRKEFQKIYAKIPQSRRPYLLAVVQGGDYVDLRRYCAQQLIKIGFDGFGYGGWPIKENGKFNYRMAQIIADLAPKDYLLYGLGIGKPEDIVSLVKMGYHIFDCVLPTRDARHQRLYVYTASSIDKIDLSQAKFYHYLFPAKQKYSSTSASPSSACDCLLCRNYSLAYLNHLFKIGDSTALRLATIHNLRFYSLLMEKLSLKTPLACPSSSRKTGNKKPDL